MQKKIPRRVDPTLAIESEKNEPILASTVTLPSECFVKFIITCKITSAVITIRERNTLHWVACFGATVNICLRLDVGKEYEAVYGKERAPEARSSFTPANGTNIWRLN
jgi:hypothetical protein